jgi:lipid-binding SYLF domain-containing protein
MYLKIRTPGVGLLSVCALLLLSAGCSSEYKSGEAYGVERPALDAEAQVAITRFQAEDPTMSRFFENSVGYAVFPDVGKGAVGIGGAYGQGVVYEKRDGQPVRIGYATLKQGTIGVQLGGQTYSEIIFFQDVLRLSNFKSGRMEFSAQASAVAAKKGASADADYDEGVAVFTLPRGGLMFEASVGGQKFGFMPADADEDLD